MHPQEFGAAHSLHSSTIDGQWWVFSVAFPEVNHNLLCFADIQQEVVVSAPRGQKVDLLPVVGLIVLGDETHQSCVVRKLHHVIGTEGCCAVVSQQGEEQGTEHTALRGPCAECDAARDVVHNRSPDSISTKHYSVHPSKVRYVVWGECKTTGYITVTVISPDISIFP